MRCECLCDFYDVSHCQAASHTRDDDTKVTSTDYAMQTIFEHFLLLFFGIESRRAHIYIHKYKVSLSVHIKKSEKRKKVFVCSVFELFRRPNSNCRHLALPFVCTIFRFIKVKPYISSGAIEKSNVSLSSQNITSDAINIFIECCECLYFWQWNSEQKHRRMQSNQPDMYLVPTYVVRVLYCVCVCVLFALAKTNLSAAIKFCQRQFQ